MAGEVGKAARTVLRHGPARTLVWAGAGVSVDPPSSLPAGGPLTDFALEVTCGTEFLLFVRRLWNRFDAVVEGIVPSGRVGGFPRLESVIQAIIECESALAEPGEGILAGFRSFRNSAPNRNHLLLGRLLQRGARVATTNFDTGIESACAQLEIAPAPGALWHVHGSAADVSALGATIAGVKDGLDPRFAGWLEGELRSGVALVFVGYSASDFFDVHRWFASIDPATLRGCSILFVQHTGSPIPESATRMLGRFPGARFVEADTTRFLELLAPAVPRTRIPPAPFDWRRAFMAAMRGSHRSWRALLQVRICNALGVSAFRFDPAIAKRCHRLKRRFSPALYHETLAVLHRIAANDRSHRYHERQRSTAADATSLLSFYVTTRDLDAAREVAWGLSELRRHLDDPGAAWSVIGSMKVHTMELLEAALAGGGRDERVRERATEICSIAEEFARKPFAAFRDLKVPANALRLHLLLRALLGEPRAGDRREEIITLYRELSCLDGLVHSLRDFGMCGILRGVAEQDAGALAEAEEALSGASRMAVEIGDAIELERLTRLRRVLDLVRAFLPADGWRRAGDRHPPPA